MPNPNDREDTTESGTLNGTSSGGDTSIGGMKRGSDSALIFHSLFASSRSEPGHKTKGFASASKSGSEINKSAHLSKNSIFLDKFSIRQALLARDRHGKFTRVRSDKEKLEELMGHVHHVQDALKEILFQEIIRLLSKEENKHLLNDASNIYKCSPLKFAFNHNKNGCLNDQIHVLLELGCIPPSDYKLPAKKTLAKKLGIAPEETDSPAPRIGVRRFR